MLHLQSFLRQGGTYEQLKEQFGISAKRHSLYPNLVLFKYSTIDSPKAHPLVRESRGTILDEANHFEVVCMPYRKFFNYGEPHVDEIDWSNASVYEKLDGSLFCLWYYNGSWHASTSGSPDASGTLSGTTTRTFSNLFWETWHSKGYKLPERVGWRGFTFIFELVGPENRIVVKYDKPNIILHGIRHKSGYEVDLDRFSNFGWDVVKSYPLRTVQEVLDAAKEIEAQEGEGFIVADKNTDLEGFHRIKLKGWRYIEAHYNRGNDFMTRRGLLKILLSGEKDEYLSYRPEFKQEFELLELQLQRACLIALLEFKMCQGLSDKEVAKIHHTLSTPAKLIFGMRKGAIKSFEEGFKAMESRQLIKVLDGEFSQ